MSSSVHAALPFGANKSVEAYLAIGQGMCHVLRVLFAVPQLAYVDDFLRVSPLVFAHLHEIVFQQVHRMVGIPLKKGKDQVARSIEPLGHVAAGSTQWVGLQLTHARAEKVTSKISHALKHGFEGKEVSKLAGDLQFALVATLGRAGKAFARGIYKGQVQRVKDIRQQPDVYRALQWCQVLLKRSIPRKEFAAKRPCHILLPDGYWNGQSCRWHRWCSTS